MKKTITQTGEFLTSINAIILFMCLLTFGMIFETQTLFFRAFPTDMNVYSRLFSSVFIVIGFEFTVLISSLNADNKKWYSAPKILAFGVFVMNLFFFNIFEPNQSFDIYILRFFVSAIVAYISYVYADLFTDKILHKEAQQNLKNSLETALNDVFEWKEKYQKAEQNLNKVEHELSLVQGKLSIAEVQLNLVQIELIKTQLSHVRNDEKRKALEEELLYLETLKN
jgi:uncharacterized protein YhhL (DUF1145 family)